MKKLICIISAVIVALTAVACDYTIVKRSDLTIEETISEQDADVEEGSTVKDITDGMDIEIDYDTSVEETTTEEYYLNESSIVENTARILKVKDRLLAAFLILVAGISGIITIIM